ncbi:MAG: anthranilate synthase component I family protein [Syntrophomonadaceae bacterium]|nr:anthranilate synthase component I family protein [Syntrophomonadaceae bacterium]MDD3889533.1 anthranilate synthase component I family protein [Syntrophomonadaceae bacterium]MDD4549894.1 anthranilate synthase component I family protein [Syntrophomonadaceae bacterium]
MSRDEYRHASTFMRAGFILPVSGAEVYPDIDSFFTMAADYDYIPITGQLKLEKLDIVKLFKLLNRKEPSCLIESLSPNNNARFSIIASKALHTFISYLDNPQGTAQLREFFSLVRVPELDYPGFFGGLIGFWTYEAGVGFQDLNYKSDGLMEYFFFMPAEILIYDWLNEVLTVFYWIRTSQAGELEYEKACRLIDTILSTARGCIREQKTGSRVLPIENSILENIDNEFEVNISKDKFCSLVERSKEHIRQGDIFQVVLSRRWRKESQADPWEVYLQLRRLNPSPYMLYFQIPEFILMAASPEVQAKVENGKITSKPIAGTRKVTGNQETDEIIAQELLKDPKERSEHLMLIDLSRNDVGRVSKAGSVQVSKFMKIEKYSHVMHIVSTVEGQVKENIDCMEAFKACFPAGTLTGAPKRKAMELINMLEKSPRGPYGGSAGYISFNNCLDSCITIRAILYKNGAYYLQSGAGIVADSNPESEHYETINKARALMIAIKEAEVIMTNRNTSLQTVL